MLQLFRELMSSWNVHRFLSLSSNHGDLYTHHIDNNETRHACVYTWRFYGTILVTKVIGIDIDPRVHGHFHLRTMDGLCLTPQEKHLRLFHLSIFLSLQCRWVKLEGDPPIIIFLKHLVELHIMILRQLPIIILRRNELRSLSIILCYC
jgi:hypothetical protein